MNNIALMDPPSSLAWEGKGVCLVKEKAEETCEVVATPLNFNYGLSRNLSIFLSIY